MIANNNSNENVNTTTGPDNNLPVEQSPSGVGDSGVQRMVENQVEAPSVVAMPLPLGLRGTHMMGVTPGSIAQARDSLGDFLSRPVKIGTIGTAGASYQTIVPWTNFLLDPQVRNKTKGFYLIRATLCVRFVMSVSQFVQGRVLVGYNPGGMYEERAFSRRSHTALSHLPYSAYIDPGIGNDVEWKIPYHYPQPYNDVDDPHELVGHILYTTQVPFTNASTGVATGTPITVLAWMEDVELKVAAYAQSGKSSSGFGTKLAAGVATAGKLVAARTPSQIAHALGDAAAFLGFTREVVQDPDTPVRLKTTSTWARTDGAEVAHTLTVDNFAEKTIATDVAVGISDDELTVAHMAGRLSYFATATWNSTQGATVEVTDWDVNPMQQVVGSPTCLSYVTSCFGYWRGSIRYRLSAVRTPFHKGKLLVKWAPPASASDGGFNTGYSVLWDLDSTPEIEIIVPFNRETYWAPVDGTDATNGEISIYVVEPLSGPSDAASVPIMLYIAAGDDYQVTCPTMHYMNQSRFSYDIVPGDLLDTSVYSIGMIPAFPQSGVTNVFVLGPDSHASDASVRSMGESVPSMRELLKRKAPVYLEPNNVAAARFYPTYPVSPDWIWAASSSTMTFADRASSGARQHLMTYLMPSFYGISGSVKWDHQFTSMNSSSFVARGFGFYGETAPLDALITNLAAGGTYVRHDLEGVVSVLSPQYIRNQFSYVSTLFNQVGMAHRNLTLPDSWPFLSNGHWVISPNGGSGPTLSLAAAGDDFNLLYYLGPPMESPPEP